MRAKPGRLVGRLLLALAWGLATAGAAGAQERTRETQLPLDTLHGLVEVDAELRRELGLFPEVEGFQVARLFVTEEGAYVLEISFRQEGRLVRERRPVSPLELGELRERIALLLADPDVRQPVSREGRAGLVLGQTALSLGFYGWALPEIMNIESTRGIVATYLLTAGAGFYLPYRITRSIPVTEAHRDAVFWGGTRGIVYGLLLGDALTLGDDNDLDPGDLDDGEDDQRVILTLGTGLSIAGSVLGYHAVGATDATRGDVGLWGTLGDLSLAWGFGTATALGLYEGEEVCQGDFCTRDDTEARVAGHLATMAVGVGGLWFAERLANRESYTLGDARALRSFGILGAQAALPLAWAAFEDTGNGHRPFAAALVAGSLGGVWWGNGILRQTSLTGGEGLLVQAGHVAGGLGAAGLTYLLLGDTDENDELVYMATSAAGSILGSLLTFRAVARSGRTGAEGPGAGDGTAWAARGQAGPGAGFLPARGSATVEVNLAGLWAPLMLDPERRTRVPVVTIRH